MLRTVLGNVARECLGLFAGIIEWLPISAAHRRAGREAGHNGPHRGKVPAVFTRDAITGIGGRGLPLALPDGERVGWAASNIFRQAWRDHLCGLGVSESSHRAMGDWSLLQ